MSALNGTSISDIAKGRREERFLGNPTVEGSWGTLHALNIVKYVVS